MSRDPTHVAILMGTRNGAAHLRAQLASIAAQDHPRWSLWVSDDGSTDATGAILQGFAARQPQKVRLLAGPGRGSAANILSLIAHPDLPPGPLAFADQDDLWLPDHLSRGLAALARGAEVRAPAGVRTPAGVAYAAPGLACDAGLTPLAGATALRHPPGFGNALVENVLAGNALMLDADAAELVRAAGVAEVPFWDWWLYLLLTGAGALVTIDARPGLFYRAHGRNQLGPRHGARAALKRLRRLFDGSYGGWVAANLRALAAREALLLPETRALLHDLEPGAPRHARALARAGAWRQTRRDAAALWAAGQLGRL